MTAEQEQLWTAFREQGSAAARETLILSHLRYVEPTVQRAIPNVPTLIDRDDLEAEARLAVVRAIDKFDPARQVTVSTWVIGSIRHRVLEYLREQDWAPRSVRQKIKRLKAAEQQALAQYGDATPGHLGEMLGLDRAEVEQLRRAASLIEVVSVEATSTMSEAVNGVVDPAPLPLAQVLDRWERQAVRRLVAALSDPQRRAVEGWYFREQKQRDVALELGISESRTSQILAAALARLQDLARARHLL